MIADRIPALKDLTPRERYLLANELWQEFEDDENSVPFDEAVQQLLEKRHAEYLDDPTKVVSWDEIKSRLSEANS